MTIRILTKVPFLTCTPSKRPLMNSYDLANALQYTIIVITVFCSYPARYPIVPTAMTTGGLLQ